MSTIKQSETGKCIPATRRPDGTWRKERRVKAGYVPQEEVPLYESKGKLFAKQPVGIPGLRTVAAAATVVKKSEPRANVAKTQPATNQEKRPIILTRPATAAATTKAEKKTEQLAEKLASSLQISAATDAQNEPLKQLRKLRKKVREIETIEAKLSSGELKSVDKDQAEKIKRKNKFLAEIKQLEKHEKTSTATTPANNAKSK